MINNLLKLSLAFTGILIGFSVFYYFVFYLPGKNENKNCIKVFSQSSGKVLCLTAEELKVRGLLK